MKFVTNIFNPIGKRFWLLKEIPLLKTELWDNLEIRGDFPKFSFVAPKEWYQENESALLELPFTGFLDYDPIDDDQGFVDISVTDEIIENNNFQIFMGYLNTLDFSGCEDLNYLDISNFEEYEP